MNSIARGACVRRGIPRADEARPERVARRLPRSWLTTVSRYSTALVSRLTEFLHKRRQLTRGWVRPDVGAVEDHCEEVRDLNHFDRRGPEPTRVPLLGVAEGVIAEGGEARAASGGALSAGAKNAAAKAWASGASSNEDTTFD